MEWIQRKETEAKLEVGSLEKRLSGSGPLNWELADQVAQKNAELDYYQSLRLKLNENKVLF
jgi:hypothetical protein